MSNPLEITKLGHPVLWKQAEPVADVMAFDIQMLIDDMFATLEEAGGVGLAAPQVGRSLRMFIACSAPFPNYEDAVEIPPAIMINPEITWASDDMIKNWEGCLSIPYLRGLVPRHAALKIRYLNRDGESVEVEYDGLMARVIQHENDHLDGKVFLDRMDTTHDLMLEEEFVKQIVEPED